jgi:hypothetical protein
MIDEATKAGMLWDEAAVKIQPSANGIEHDESSMAFSVSRPKTNVS